LTSSCFPSRSFLFASFSLLSSSSISPLIFFSIVFFSSFSAGSSPYGCLSWCEGKNLMSKTCSPGPHENTQTSNFGMMNKFTTGALSLSLSFFSVFWGGGGSRFQIQIVQSSEPDAKYLPSLLKHTLVTCPLCFLRICLFNSRGALWIKSSSLWCTILWGDDAGDNDGDDGAGPLWSITF